MATRFPSFHETWYDWAGFSCQPNLLAGLMPYLDRDEIEVYIWMFFNAFIAAYSPNIQRLIEHPRPILGFSNAEPFKTSDEANAIKWMRYMFVYGKGTRFISAGAPARVAERREPSTSDACTLGSVRFPSTMSRTLHKAGSSARPTWHCTATPARTLVRFRHPEKRPSNPCASTAWSIGPFDPLKGDVDVSGKSGALVIEAFFAPAPPAAQPR